MKRQSQGLCSITTTVSIDHLLVKGFDAKQGSTDEDQHWNFAPSGKRFFIINKCSRRQMVPQHLMCSMYVLSISLDSASPILSFLLSFGQHGTEKMPNGKLEDRSCGWRPFDEERVLESKRTAMGRRRYLLLSGLFYLWKFFKRFRLPSPFQIFRTCVDFALGKCISATLHIKWDFSQPVKVTVLDATSSQIVSKYES